MDSQEKTNALLILLIELVIETHLYVPLDKFRKRLEELKQ